MTISDRLRSLIERKGLSISAVAELAGMNRQEVWRIVRGKVKNPGIDTVRRIVEAADSTMAELFQEEE